MAIIQMTISACAILVGVVALLQGAKDLAVVDVARMRAALVATVAMSVVSVTMDSILAIGITVSQTCVNCVQYVCDYVEGELVHRPPAKREKRLPAKIKVWVPAEIPLGGPHLRQTIRLRLPAKVRVGGGC